MWDVVVLLPDHCLSIFFYKPSSSTYNSKAERFVRNCHGKNTMYKNTHILSFLLPLFQEGQLSVTGESMCTKYWLTA